jgi:hypothetical protein
MKIGGLIARWEMLSPGPLIVGPESSVSSQHLWRMRQSYDVDHDNRNSRHR